MQLKTCCQGFNERAWKVLHLVSGFGDPTTTTTYFPNPSATSLDSLEAAHDFGVIFHVPSQNTVLKGTLEKASSVDIRGVKSNSFTSISLVNETSPIGDSFLIHTHLSGSLTPHSLRAESLIPEVP